MSTLDDDIARIAALRGKKAADYADPERFVARPVLERYHVENVFRMSRDGKADQEAFDALPQASRDFIRECPQPINSIAWSGLLVSFREADLITEARKLIRWPETKRNPSLRRSRLG